MKTLHHPLSIILLLACSLIGATVGNAAERPHADDPEQIGPDPCQWRLELGDPELIDAYFENYTQQFERLSRLPDERPGRTGSAVGDVVEKLKTKKP